MASGSEIAPDYDGLSEHVPDNAYLYYANFKLAHVNSRLDRLVSAVWATNVLLAGILGTLYFG